MYSHTKIDRLLAGAERIGVIGSPSSTSELSLDILGSAVTRKLVGELALFQFIQDGQPHYALGQITEVALRNVWHEDSTMRSLIRQHGRVDAVSERQDTHLGKMTVSAVFADYNGRFQPSILGTVPATGTAIYVVDDRVLDLLIADYRHQMFYLGKVYGSNSKLPLWFKHFASGSAGAGEAYHIGVFGKTGSGKSVLSKMILLAYAKHPQMGIFILDPQGEFSNGLGNPSLPRNMGEILNPELLQKLGKHHVRYDLKNIQLDRWEVLRELMIEFEIFFDLGFKNTNYQAIAADYFEKQVKKKYTFAALAEDPIPVLIAGLDHVAKSVKNIFSGSDGQERVKIAVEEVKDAIRTGEDLRIVQRWTTIAGFFAPSQVRRTATQIVQQALSTTKRQRPIVVIDLSKAPDGVSPSFWNDKIRPLILDRFLTELITQAEHAYQDNQSLNTLVVVDEAHRLAPAGRIDNPRLDRIRMHLVDAVRTTRKYGLGWMFLSQTLSSLDNEIVQQLRISFFGFGLGMGTEYQKLRELVAGQKESLNLYQRFRDPHSSFDSNFREYSFMTIGPVSPLSFAGTPLFLNAFNSVDDFIGANGLIKQPSLFEIDPS